MENLISLQTLAEDDKQKTTQIDKFRWLKGTMKATPSGKKVHTPS